MDAGHSIPQGPPTEPEPVSRQVPCMWFSNVPVNMVVEGGPDDKKVSLQATCCQWSRDPKVHMLRNPATGNYYGRAILAVRPCVSQSWGAHTAAHAAESSLRDVQPRNELCALSGGLCKRAQWSCLAQPLPRGQYFQIPDMHDPGVTSNRLGHMLHPDLCPVQCLGSQLAPEGSLYMFPMHVPTSSTVSWSCKLCRWSVWGASSHQEAACT